MVKKYKLGEETGFGKFLRQEYNVGQETGQGKFLRYAEPEETPTIQGITWASAAPVSTSWASSSYNPQPGFTAGTGSMGYNIAPTAQGVAPYSTEAPLSTDIANPFIDYLPQEFLEQTPSAAYYSVPSASEFYTRPSGTIDPSKKKFYQESFQDIYSDYLGKLGGMAREGETPDLRFTDYLSQQDPFTERYAKLSPYQRGVDTGYYAPKTRFIYY